MDNRRAQLRAELRTLHPDVGGDPARFQEALASYRALSPSSSADARDYRGEVRFVVCPHRAQKVLRACAHPLRTLATRRSAAPRVH